MTVYVVHKKGFFYTDEAFVEANEEDVPYVGSVVAQYSTLKEAEDARDKADKRSMTELAGMSAVDFFFYADDYDAVFQKLETYFKQEFGIEIEDPYWFEFPSSINVTQAEKLLEMLDLSFHEIVPYDSSNAIAKKTNADDMIGEF